MKLQIEFNLDNAIFEVDRQGEIRRILALISDKINDETNHDLVMDINGNIIGIWSIEKE